MIPKPEDIAHKLTVDIVEDDLYIIFQHEMTKQHYISFVVYVSSDKMLFVKLYPEQTAEVRFPKMHGGDIYFYCSEHGLAKASKENKPIKKQKNQAGH